MKRTVTIILLIGLFVTGMTGCRSTSIEDPHIPSIFLEASSSAPGSDNPYITLPVSGTQLRIYGKPLFGPLDIIRIEMVQVDRGLAVRYLLTPSASRELMRSTGDNVGYAFIFFDNDSPIGARRIDGMIEDGILYTFLEVPDEKLPELVNEMNRTLVEFRRKNR